MKYKVIGDIHGRTNWKKLVDVDNAINIFIGDYFDPYDSNIDFDIMSDNFNEIIKLKKEHPDNVILLYGNHDYHYMADCTERYSRFQIYCARKIEKLLLDNDKYFDGIAYAIGDKYIVTHAGITNEWAMNRLPDTKVEPMEMAKAINELWKENKWAFSFENNSGPYDYYGDTCTHSPIWIRPQTLDEHNLYKGTDVKQIIGHTQVSDVTEINGLILVDCLGTVDNCYELEFEEN